MNKLYIIILLFSSTIFTACDKFLDVEPRNQIEKGKLFESESGFKDALTGVYIQLKHQDAYGARLTQTTIEQMISNWNVTSGSVEQKIGLFNYKDADVDKALSAILSKQYSIVASINAILDNIEKEKTVFKTSGLYELVKGECLALRAYLHLDILRLFGPMPIDPSKGNTLAYVTELSRSIHSRIDYEQYKIKLLEDIREAEDLLIKVDPILQYSLSELRSPNHIGGTGYQTEDEFFAFRGIRMNYFAVRALAARAQLWFGNKSEAYIAAKEVIEAKNGDGKVKFRLGTGTDFTAGDYVLREEHIFGLYDIKMYDWYQSRYQKISLYKGTDVNTIKQTLYGNTGTDIRESSLWSLLTADNGSRGNIIKKYEVKPNKDVTVATDFKQIPLLRSGEMYLILAETAPFSEGVDYLRVFRTSRGLSVGDPVTAEQLQNEIVKEYRKEFYAEGQGFYAYKRNNVGKSNFVFVPSNATVNYILPLPTVEESNIL